LLEGGEDIGSGHDASQGTCSAKKKIKKKTAYELAYEGGWLVCSFGVGDRRVML